MIGLSYIVLCEARLDSMLMISLGEFGGMHAPSKILETRFSQIRSQFLYAQLYFLKINLMLSN